MQPSIRNLFLLLAGALYLSGCERAAVDTSKVSLQLPVYAKAVNGLACTICLKAIVVNIDGDNFKTITLNQYHLDITQAGTQLDSDIVIEVPSGAQRRIQVLALYRGGGDGNQVNIMYGNTTADLTSAAPEVQVQLQSLDMIGGSIVGRYLTSVAPDTGPTGNVNIEFQHPSTGMKIKIIAGEILNGWFELPAAKNRKLTYTLESTGEILFGGAVNTDFFKESAAVGHVAHITRPATYYTNPDVNGTYTKIEGAHDLVYGFFSEKADLSAKKVCLSEAMGSPLPFDNIFTGPTAGAPFATYSHNDVMADVYGTGGLFGSSYCGSIGNNQSYTTDKITVQKSQLDGRGNDYARSIRGAFSYRASGGMPRLYMKHANQLGVMLSPLPGVIASGDPSAPYDGIRLYTKSNANESYDHIQCGETWMQARGFTEVTSFQSPPALNASGDVSFLFANAPGQDDGFIACPSKTVANAKKMDGRGGFFVGPIRLAQVSGGNYNFGIAAVGSPQYMTIQIENTGNQAASFNVLPFSGGVFSFRDGAYPGTGGTCGFSLAAGATCTYSLKFLPITTGVVSDYFHLIYESGDKSADFYVEGQGT